jgi:hypothetical protein
MELFIQGASSTDNEHYRYSNQISGFVPEKMKIRDGPEESVALAARRVRAAALHVERKSFHDFSKRNKFVSSYQCNAFTSQLNQSLSFEARGLCITTERGPFANGPYENVGTNLIWFHENSP